jgi:hypothetical protein
MTEATSDAAKEALVGLEAALRDSAARALMPDMPILLALRFFRSVIGLSRCLREFREMAGQPRALSPELVQLLVSVHIRATGCRRAVGLTDPQALRVDGAIMGLSRAVALARQVPEKAKQPAVKPQALSQPAVAAPPRRRNDLDNIGMIAIRAQNAAAIRNPVFEDAYRKAMGGKIGA